MEKLKCSNCGSPLELDEDKEFASCKFCNTKYKLNEDKNINVNIKLDENTKESIKKGVNSAKETLNKNKKIPILLIIPFIIIFITVFVFIILVSIDVFKGFRTANTTVTGVKKNISQTIFNSPIEVFKGTKKGSMIYSLIDQIDSSNKRNDNKIVITIDDTKFKDTNDILKIKSMIDKDKEYEVILNYDNDKLINECIIKEINK